MGKNSFIENPITVYEVEAIVFDNVLYRTFEVKKPEDARNEMTKLLNWYGYNDFKLNIRFIEVKSGR